MENYELIAHMETIEENLFQLADGNELFYQYKNARADAPTVLFLNGLSQSTLAWSAIASSFGEQANILLIDLVFQGKSTSLGDFRSYDQHAHDVAALVRHLNIENGIVCGLSYGSAVVQHLLVVYPDLFKAGVLMSTFAHNTAVFNAIGESWKAALHAGGYPLLLDIMLPVVLGASYFERPLIPIETMKEMRVSNSPTTENLLRLMMATEVRGDYRSNLGAIRVPVLVLHGDEDVLIPVAVAQEVTSHIPNGREIILPGVGHTLNLEAIPQTLKILREFVSEIGD